jgi:predicted Rossmann fold flavoprotein
MKKYDCVIIGAGASGMMAGIMAERRGKHVLIVEKSDKIGRKILVTGNGRCNLTNKNVVEDYKRPVHYFGENPKFVLSVLNQFGLEDTLEFFEKLGIGFKEEDNGRLFPVSNQAQSVIDVLLYEVRELGIKVAKPNKTRKISFNKKTEEFEFELNDGQQIVSPKLVVATGGLTHVELGATGDGYEIAQKFGHRITPTFPAYSAMIVKSPLCQKLQGVKLEVKVVAFSQKGRIAENEGTLMFAHFGLSAPSVLEISRQIAHEIKINNGKVRLEINFLPFLAPKPADEFIRQRWENSSSKPLSLSFTGILPKKVFPSILEAAGIDPERKVSTITKEERAQIVSLLTKHEFAVEDIRGFDEAHFTAGGVDTKEIDPKTLESKLQKGLYFCGEVMDIDGQCGGYNLQWAWSSGAVVGNNI